jgi:DNA-binding NtrC family response regulator
VSTAPAARRTCRQRRRAFAADIAEQIEDRLRAEAERRREDRRIAADARPGPLDRAQHHQRLPLDRGQSARSAISGVDRRRDGTGRSWRRARSIVSIRARSGRSPVNCGAIAAGLAESELFGHRHGAFTGAEHDRRGGAQRRRLFSTTVGDLDVTSRALPRALQAPRARGR